MSNRTNIDQELQRYLDELLDTVDRYVRDQENDANQDIRRIQLVPSKLYQHAATVMEELYFEDKLSVTEAIKDAADMVVNASIFATMRHNDTTRYLDDALYNDLQDDHRTVEEIMRRNGGGNDRYNDRGGRNSSARDTRTAAAGRVGREERNSRRSGDDNQRRDYGNRDDRGGRNDRNDRNDRDQDRNEAQRRADERAAQRAGRTGDNQNSVRDQKVEQAKVAIDVNTAHPITLEYIKTKPELFVTEGKSIPLAPVYFLGNQRLSVLNDKIKVEAIGQIDMADMEYEAHRTDLYLKSRTNNAPSATMRDQAVKDAIEAREQYGADVIEKMMVQENVVTAKSPVVIDQFASSAGPVSVFYGEGTPMTIINGSLNALKLNHLPKHPITVSVMRYPLWTLTKRQSETFKALVASSTLDVMMNNLVRLQTEVDDKQWTYIHDRITVMFNEILKVELEVAPYLDSIVRDWNDFVQWLEKYNNGALVHWFNNNVKGALERTFVLTDKEHALPHSFVTGEDDSTMAVGFVTRFIYVPVSSDNFLAASVTKLGRVLESVTPDLYKLIVQSLDTTANEYRLVTSNDEAVNVYHRASTISSKILFIGDVNW